MKDIKLVVRNIIGEPIDGYSRVTVSNELFNAVRGMKPLLPYKGMGDNGGNGVRVFTVNGVELCASYDKETRKTMFLMRTEEAKKHLLTLTQQREGEAKMPFNANSFDRSIVATA